MIKNRKVLFGFIVVVISIVFGGITLMAAGEPEPGSGDDPLITLSYFNQEIAKLNVQPAQDTAVLQTELNNTKKELGDVKAELSSVKEELKTLKEALNSIKTGAGTDGTKQPEQTTPSTKPSTPEADSLGYGYVTASSLNVREGPATTYKKVGVVSKNNKVALLSKKGDWYKIKYGSITGWVLGTYIKK